MGEVPETRSGYTLVALPYVSKQGFSGATTQSLVLAILGGGLRFCRFLFLGDQSQVQARNAACRDAIDTGAEYLFFVDSDADFPVDTLARLKACNADIACADMWARNIPSFRTVMRLEAPDERGMRKSVPVPGWPAGVEDVDLCGMHCTLIRTGLLKRMQKPWFWVAEHGEDATFCFNAKQVGATVRCDFSVMSGHWGAARMAGQDWSRDSRNQPMTVVEKDMMKRMGAENLP